MDTQSKKKSVLFKLMANHKSGKSTCKYSVMSVRIDAGPGYSGNKDGKFPVQTEGTSDNC